MPAVPGLGEVLAGQLFEQFHKMAFGKAAHFGCLLCRKGRSVILPEVERQLFYDIFLKTTYQSFVLEKQVFLQELYVSK